MVIEKLRKSSPEMAYVDGLLGAEHKWHFSFILPGGAKFGIIMRLFLTHIIYQNPTAEDKTVNFLLWMGFVS